MSRTGAQIVVEALLAEGVDCLFGYPGGTVLDLYDELFRNAHRLTHYATCHEQAAAHAADGYARATGKVGVCLASAGPGATNLVTGIAAAYHDSVPIVAITGNVPTALLGRDSFQEVDIACMTMPITKHNYTVRDVNKLGGVLREAFAVARSGRPGPVLVDIPKDVQAAVCADALPPKAQRKPAPEIPQARYQEAAALIAASARPVLYVGGGAVDAGAAVCALAARIDAPIAASMMGLSAVDNRDARFLGMAGMHGGYAANRVMDESDLIVALGARFSDRATGDKQAFAHNRRVLQIDIDPAEIGKNIPAYTALVGDLHEALRRLTPLVCAAPKPEWLAFAASVRARAAAPAPPPEGLSPRHIIERLRAYMPADGLLATDVGQHQMWAAQWYAFTQARTFLTSGGLGAMGYGMGAAMGGCLARDRRRTALVTGDGSFHMNLNEMAAAVRHRLPLAVVVFNNNALGMVRQWQTFFYGGRHYATTPEYQTDYVRLARSFGADGAAADSPQKLEAALEAAFARETPFVIDARVHEDEQVLPMIPAGGSMRDIILPEEGGNADEA